MDGFEAAGFEVSNQAIVVYLADISVKYFTLHLNSSLDEEQPSADWLTSTVILVHEGGKTVDFGSYTHVSVISKVPKTRERHL